MKYIVQNKNSNYSQVIDSIINSKKRDIFSFFNSEEVDLPFNIYVYDSKEELVKGLRVRGFKKGLDYMCACYKDEDNSLFEPKYNPNNDEWSKDEYKNVIFHELIHGIQFTLFGTTSEWLSEGIAKYLDGIYSKGIKWLLDNYINGSSISSQDEIESEFGMHDYDSYDYAYLIDNLGKDNFIELLKDKKQIKNVRKVLLVNSINYYNEKYKGKTRHTR